MNGHEEMEGGREGGREEVCVCAREKGEVRTWIKEVLRTREKE